MCPQRTAPPDRPSRPPCPICDGTMDGKRRHAIYCSGICRAEASRIRRLASGRIEGLPYQSLPQRRAVQEKRTAASHARQANS
jgi:hypothetical protein